MLEVWFVFDGSEKFKALPVILYVNLLQVPDAVWKTRP